MVVSSTEIQNNFGRYLMLAMKEDITITKNGGIIATLTTEDTNPDSSRASDTVNEKAANYSYGGRKASYEEFLKLTKDNEERYEYIDGEIYYLASPKTAHQTALSELFVAFYNWFQGKKCTAMLAPYDINLKRHKDDKNLVQPDIMVICDLKEKLDKRDYYMGVPSLVVEILSESTRSKDIIKKLDLYMSCDVKEYWIVNPLNKEVTVYLFKDRDICSCTTFRKTESVSSCIFEGLTVELKNIFR